MIAFEEDLESGVGPVPDPIASLVRAISKMDVVNEFSLSNYS